MYRRRMDRKRWFRNDRRKSFDGIKGQESAVVGAFDELFHRALVVFIDDFGSYHFAAYQAHKIKR